MVISQCPMLSLFRKFNIAIPLFLVWQHSETRMHTSRMRTIRCSGRHLGGGLSVREVSTQGGVSAWGGLPRKVSAQGVFA